MDDDLQENYWMKKLTDLPPGRADVSVVTDKSHSFSCGDGWFTFSGDNYGCMALAFRKFLNDDLQETYWVEKGGTYRQEGGFVSSH